MAEHSLPMAVRDYECDLQGVVNNAVYQNYLEHARHEFLKAHGIDFAALARQGIHLVVVRAELDYRESLGSGDRFEVSTRVEREGRLRFVFVQRIRNGASGRTALDARVTGVALNEKGRPFVPVDLDVLLGHTAAAGEPPEA